jgi:hypothetical protein
MYSRKYIIAMIYITMLLLLFTIKPFLLFDNNGDIKHYNYEKNNIISIEIILPILIIISFIIYMIIDIAI